MNEKNFVLQHVTGGHDFGVWYLGFYNFARLLGETRSKFRFSLDSILSKYDMKQGELAEKVGVRRETIIRLEKGQYNPSLKLAMDIAKLFGTTVEELFSFDEE